MKGHCRLKWRNTLEILYGVHLETGRLDGFDSAAYVGRRH